MPAIHVADLASVLVAVVENKPETHYILAIDEGVSTLEDYTRVVSTTLGTGKVCGGDAIDEVFIDNV